VGPFRYSGRRRDDPNDRYAHENRREVRGFGVFSAWVNNADAIEDNTLDMYEGEDGRGHLVHYQQDVGGSFDAWGASPKPYWIGHESWFSTLRVLRSLLTFGISTSEWEEQRYLTERDRLLAASPALAAFTEEHFDPRTWQPIFPNPAFSRLTRRDRYWAAKRIAFIDAHELRAAISAGRYQPEAAARLFQILWKRRELVLRAYLGEVSALDHFYFDGARLCFEDLWLRAGLGGASVYEARVDRQRRRPLVGSNGAGWVEVASSPGYRIVELRVERAGLRESSPVRVHFIERDGVRRVLGVER
jgi:hypothetical protein